MRQFLQDPFFREFILLGRGAFILGIVAASLVAGIAFGEYIAGRPEFVGPDVHWGAVALTVGLLLLLFKEGLRVIRQLQTYLRSGANASWVGIGALLFGIAAAAIIALQTRYDDPIPPGTEEGTSVELSLALISSCGEASIPPVLVINPQIHVDDRDTVFVRNDVRFLPPPRDLADSESADGIVLPPAFIVFFEEATAPIPEEEKVGTRLDTAYVDFFERLVDGLADCTGLRDTVKVEVRGFASSSEYGVDSNDLNMRLANVRAKTVERTLSTAIEEVARRRGRFSPGMVVVTAQPWNSPEEMFEGRYFNDYGVSLAQPGKGVLTRRVEVKVLDAGRCGDP